MRQKKNRVKYDEAEHYIKKKERSYKKASRKKDKSYLKNIKKGNIDYDDYMEKMEDQF
tara:strand:+ start:1062 stop:1235 length:174 start_codon:yes stop_codon:yes gene_type:complete